MNNIRRFSTLLLAMVMLFSISVPAYATDVDTGCSCSPEEGIHQQGCALYELSCSGKEGCAAATHNEGCPAAVVACSGLEACTAATHNEACLSQVPKAPACDKTENCPASEGHEEGCLKAAAEAKAAEEAAKAAEEAAKAAEEAAKAAEEAAKAAAVKAVQDMIDTLPDVPVGYSPENPPAEIADQLQAITEAIAALPEDVASTIDQHVDMYRYYAFYAPGPAAVATIGEVEYDSLEAAIENAGVDAVITITDNIGTLVPIIIPEGKKLTIDFNGYTLSAEMDDAHANQPAIRVLGSLTVKDSSAKENEAGKGGISTKSAEDKSCYCFIVGSNDLDHTSTDYIIPSLTIESGTYKGTTSAVSVTKGKLTINGGEFSARPWKENGIDQYQYLINCIDTNYTAGIAAISITGGIFHNFDPTNNKAESGTGGTNFVAENYTSATDDNGNFMIVDGVASVGGTEYLSLAEAFEAAATNGGTITLLENIVLYDSATLKAGKTATLDLNGKKIYAELTSKPAIRVLGELEVIATNGGSIESGSASCYCFIVGNSETPGKLTISSGTFKGGTSAISISRGDLIINGGSFESMEYEGDHRYLLNCIDTAYTAKTAKISVNGGSFKNFDPNNNLAEGEKTDFLEADKSAVKQGDGSYEVGSPVVSLYSGETLINSYANFEDAYADAADGNTIKLYTDINSSDITVISKAITLDGNGNALNYSGSGDKARAINVSCSGHVTIKNLTVNAANAERAINVIGSPVTLTIDNVSAEAGHYTVNVAASASGAAVNIKDSELTGYAAINVRGNSTVTVENSELVGKPAAKTDDAGNSFAVVSIAEEINAKVHVKGGKIIASYDPNTNDPYFPGSLDAPSLENGSAIEFEEVAITKTAPIDIYKSSLYIKVNNEKYKTLAYGDFTNAIANFSQSIDSTIYLADDVTVHDSAAIPTTLHISMRDNIIHRASGFTGNVFTPAEAVEITLECSLNGMSIDDVRKLLPDLCVADISSAAAASRSEKTNKFLIKAAHTLGTAATCKEAAKCANCGQSYGSTISHTGGTATCTAQAVCSVCGDSYGSTLPHSGGTATCTAQAICVTCNQPYGEMLDHSYIYSVDSAKPNVIKESCKNCNTHNATATLELKKNFSTTYTGSAIDALTVSYSAKSGSVSAWEGSRNLTVSYLGTNGKPTNIYPGKATGKISIKGADDKDATAVMIFDINKMEIKMWEHNDFYRDSGATLSFTIETNGKEPMKPVGPISLYSTAGKHLKDVRDYGVSYKNGDAVITLPAYALKGLDVGRYDLQVYLADSTDSSNTILAEAVDQFRVRYPRIIPSTGDSANFLLWGGMLIGAAAAMGGALVLLKKSSRKSK